MCRPSLTSLCETTNCNGVPVKYRYEAAVHCLQCLLNMCVDCQRAHKRSSKTRRHVTCDVVERPPLPPTPDDDPPSTSTFGIEIVKEEPASHVVKFEPLEEELAEPNSERPFPCTQCAYSTQTSHSLYLHMQSHKPTEEREFSCDECPFKTHTLRSLNLHKRVHTGYKCSICSKAMSHLATLKGHMLSAHNDVEMFACDEADCTYTTIVRRRFVVHKAKHTAKEHVKSLKAKATPHLKSIERPYHCSLCTHQAVTRSTFVSHVTRRHVDEGTMMQCCFCAFVARGLRFMTIHMEVHHICEHTVQTIGSRKRRASYTKLNAEPGNLSDYEKSDNVIDENSGIIVENLVKIERED